MLQVAKKQIRRRKCRHSNAPPSSAKESNKGQAITEFALIIVFLLMVIFIIVESARIMWAWVTVQNSARAAARYGITGQFDPAFQYDTNPRVSSIKDVAAKELLGLKLNNDPNAAFEDDYYYLIEVYGVNDIGQLVPNDAGAPGKPLVVRVTYRVPIIVPLLSSIVDSLPVFGQIVENNEQFGQLGGAGQGEGLPPPLPQVPTPGVTPSPTASPTNTNTPLPTSTATLTPSPTFTPTNTPIICGTHFEGDLIAGNNFLFVTGEVGETVTILDLTSGATLGSATLVAISGHDCAGFDDFTPNVLNSALQEGHVILVQSSNGTTDTSIVVAIPPTPTTVPTNTPIPTDTPTATPVTPTSTPTATPLTPFLWLVPDCANPPNHRFEVYGNQWPPSNSVSLFFDDQLQGIVSTDGSGVFQPQTWSFPSAADGSYTIQGRSQGIIATAQLTVPCPDYTPPAPTATPTATPSPIDLLIIGQPQLLNTAPISEHVPLNFAVNVQNSGDFDITDQFFVDIYFNSPPVSRLAAFTFPNLVSSTLNTSSADANPYSIASALGTGGAALMGNTTDGNPPPSAQLGSDWDQTSFASAQTDGDYLTFDISPNAGITMTLDTLSFELKREQATEINHYALVADEMPGSGGDNFTTIIISGTVGTSANWQTFSADLSTIGFLRNVTTDTTFRLYFWGTAGTDNISIDNLTLDGHALPAGINPNTIPISQTVGYTSLSFLGAKQSQVVTITTFVGLSGGYSSHEVYSMVDSLSRISESNEDNNLAGPIIIQNVGCYATNRYPTPTTHWHCHHFWNCFCSARQWLGRTSSRPRKTKRYLWQPHCYNFHRR